MNEKDPYLNLIEISISKYNKKYEKKLRYEIIQFPYNYQFIIYDDITPILYKSIHYECDTKMSEVYSEIITDLFVGIIERIYMQFHNQKRILPKKHGEIDGEIINITKGKW